MDHKTLQILVGCVVAFGVAIISFYVGWSLRNPKSKPESKPEPEPKRAPVKLCVQTIYGKRTIPSHSIRYPSSGHLIVEVNETIAAIFAPGKWVSAENGGQAYADNERQSGELVRGQTDGRGSVGADRTTEEAGNKHFVGGPQSGGSDSGQHAAERGPDNRSADSPRSDAVGHPSDSV
jgi:hypothetical protein